MDLTELIEQHREALKGFWPRLSPWSSSARAASAGRRRCRAISTAPCSACFVRPNWRRGVWPSCSRGVLSQPASRTGPPRPRPARRSLCVRAPAPASSGGPARPFRRRFAHLVPRKAACPRFSFPLLDPLPRISRRGLRQRPGAALPRIGMAGMAALPALPEWRPPLPDDPIDAGRLGRRLEALSRVLDDLPGLARRFARWQARRDLHSPRAVLIASRHCVAARRRAGAWRATILKPGAGAGSARSTRSWRMPMRSPTTRWRAPARHVMRRAAAATPRQHRPARKISPACCNNPSCVRDRDHDARRLQWLLRLAACHHPCRAMGRRACLEGRWKGFRHRRLGAGCCARRHVQVFGDGVRRSEGRAGAQALRPIWRRAA